MNKKDLIIKILGLAISTTIGLIGLVMDARRKHKITEEDKEDIAEKVVLRLGIENN